MSITTAAPPSTATDLSLTRMHLMRAGYLLMGVGLALVKWPLLPDAADLSLYEGVTLCLLTAPWSSSSSPSPRGGTCGATTCTPPQTGGDDPAPGQVSN